MIDLSQEQLASMLISSFLCGVLLGVVYEGIRFLKLLCTPQGKHLRLARSVILHILTFLTDLAFILLYALVAILLTYRISGGVFRGMVYIGMTSGFALYYFTIGKLTLKISRGLAKLIKKTVKMLLKLVYTPIRAIFLLIVKLYTLTIGKIIGKIICSIKQKREKRKATSSSAETPPALVESREEKGYRKEGRISFGGKRAS